jgi:hypothetical protein
MVMATRAQRIPLPPERGIPRTDPITAGFGKSPSSRIPGFEIFRPDVIPARCSDDYWFGRGPVQVTPVLPVLPAQL